MFLSPYLVINNLNTLPDGKYSIFKHICFNNLEQKGTYSVSCPSSYITGIRSTSLCINKLRQVAPTTKVQRLDIISELIYFNRQREFDLLEFLHFKSVWYEIQSSKPMLT